MDVGQRVLRLDELDEVALPEVPLAVLGDPIAHSLSPVMHNAALAAMAQDDPSLAGWRYLALHVPIEQLPEAVRTLHARGFRGVNLTIPHKVEAVALVTRVAEEARPMGAVNTLVAEEGGFFGTNTDGYGIARAVAGSVGRGLADGPVVLCGAGGAARAIAVQALRDGVPELWLGNRGPQNLERLLEQLRGAGMPMDRVRPFLFAEPPSGLPADGLLINATAAGLKEGDGLPLDLAFLGSRAAIYDTTYGQRNAWAAFAGVHGLPYGDGLAMLVAQGVRSLEIWTGRAVPEAVMDRAAREAFFQRTQAS